MDCLALDTKHIRKLFNTEWRFRFR